MFIVVLTLLNGCTTDHNRKFVYFEETSSINSSHSWDMDNWDCILIEQDPHFFIHELLNGAVYEHYYRSPYNQWVSKSTEKYRFPMFEDIDSIVVSTNGRRSFKQTFKSGRFTSYIHGEDSSLVYKLSYDSLGRLTRVHESKKNRNSYNLNTRDKSIRITKLLYNTDNTVSKKTKFYNSYTKNTAGSSTATEYVYNKDKSLKRELLMEDKNGIDEFIISAVRNYYYYDDTVRIITSKPLDSTNVLQDETYVYSNNNQTYRRIILFNARENSIRDIKRTLTYQNNNLKTIATEIKGEHKQTFSASPLKKMTYSNTNKLIAKSENERDRVSFTYSHGSKLISKQRYSKNKTSGKDILVKRTIFGYSGSYPKSLIRENYSRKTGDLKYSSVYNIDIYTK